VPPPLAFDPMRLLDERSNESRRIAALLVPRTVRFSAANTSGKFGDGAAAAGQNTSSGDGITMSSTGDGNDVSASTGVSEALTLRSFHDAVDAASTPLRPVSHRYSIGSVSRPSSSWSLNLPAANDAAANASALTSGGRPSAASLHVNTGDSSAAAAPILIPNEFQRLLAEALDLFRTSRQPQSQSESLSNPFSSSSASSLSSSTSDSTHDSEVAAASNGGDGNGGLNNDQSATEYFRKSTQPNNAAAPSGSTQLTIASVASLAATATSSSASLSSSSNAVAAASQFACVDRRAMTAAQRAAEDRMLAILLRLVYCLPTGGGKRRDLHMSRQNVDINVGASSGTSASAGNAHSTVNGINRPDSDSSGSGSAGLVPIPVFTSAASTTIAASIAANSAAASSAPFSATARASAPSPSLSPAKPPTLVAARNPYRASLLGARHAALRGYLIETAEVRECVLLWRARVLAERGELEAAAYDLRVVLEHTQKNRFVPQVCVECCRASASQCVFSCCCSDPVILCNLRSLILCILFLLCRHTVLTDPRTFPHVYP
jgi:hypothetical protein